MLLAGVPCDFRLDYGRQIRSATTLISVNRGRHDLYLNRKPTLAIEADADSFLIELSRVNSGSDGHARAAWRDLLAARDDEREREIDHQASAETDGINPLQLFRALDGMLGENSVLVADGGDFVATASYTLHPRGPLAWLDPGPFGTLGIGGGFALGAKLVRPEYAALRQCEAMRVMGVMRAMTPITPIAPLTPIASCRLPEALRTRAAAARKLKFPATAFT
jgi:acetolactate synthase-1/2/3 large subunit